MALQLPLRAVNAFVLDLLNIYRGDRDFADALILSALIQCMYAGLAGDPQAQRRYATFETPVPEELRRSISINSIATSLGLPFETVRRRMRRLITEGLCERTSDGVRVSKQRLFSASHRRELEEAYRAVHRLHLELLQADCLHLTELPRPVEPFAHDAKPPLRIVWRASAGFFLRVTEITLPRFASLTQAFAFMEVARANTEDRANGCVMDGDRRPVRASEVAARLGLPYETVRRNLGHLAANGYLSRVAEGHIVPLEVLARPDMAAAWRAEHSRNLSRMFADLAQAGVLAYWAAKLG